MHYIYKNLYKQFTKILTDSCYEFSIDIGWYDLVKELCQKIQQHMNDNKECPQVTAFQVKEKFGGLRFYIYGGDDTTYDLIHQAEMKSLKICERCGAEGRCNHDDLWYLLTLCEDCRRIRIENHKRGFAQQENLTSDEMKDLFSSRTKKHIALVQKYAKILEESLPEFNGALNDIVKTHDNSKFSEEEITGYTLTTWSYKEVGKSSTHPYAKAAWDHHKMHNDHHPEYWNDVLEMPKLSIAHMVCDWAAMSEELGTSLTQWAANEGLKRWPWSQEQTQIILSFIKATGIE